MDYRMAILLLIAHLLGDFVFQPQSWIKVRDRKHYRSPFLYLHSLVHALLSIVVLFFDTGFWWIPLVIFISHSLIDIAKSYIRKASFTGFIADQFLHILVIAACWVIAYDIPFPGVLKAGLENEGLLPVVLGYLVICSPASVAVRIFTSSWSGTVEEYDLQERSLDNAGKTIGYLERILVFTFILVNQFAAIGFLLAAKSIIRFGEMKNIRVRNQTEYILIGTLLSFGIAILSGLAVKAFLAQG